MSEVIASVKDNQEKYETYRSNIGKYTLAMEYGFYFEAMMIDYAMLEDRLSSFLVACGVLFAPDHFSLGSKANRYCYAGWCMPEVNEHTAMHATQYCW